MVAAAPTVLAKLWRISALREKKLQFEFL
jgi:hypothetical protein